MSRKKEITVEEMFCGMPALRKYFRDLEKNIATFDVGTEKNAGVEALKEKREKLLRAMQEMTPTDMWIVYYINHLRVVNPYSVLYALRKISQGQCELENEIRNTDTYKDPMEGEILR